MSGSGSGSGSGSEGHAMGRVAVGDVVRGCLRNVAGTAVTMQRKDTLQVLGMKIFTGAGGELEKNRPCEGEVPGSIPCSSNGNKVKFLFCHLFRFHNVCCVVCCLCCISFCTV